MSVWSKADEQRVEQRLRTLVAAGHLIEDAVRVVHIDEGVGALLICSAVESVAGVAAAQAKQLVASSLAASRD